MPNRLRKVGKGKKAKVNKRRRVTRRAPGQWKDRTLAVTALIGISAFLYQLQEILTKHTDWGYFKMPPGVGEVLFAAVCGLVAVGTALGIDVGNLTRGLIRKEK